MKKSIAVIALSFLGLLSATGCCEQGGLAVGDYLAVMLILFGVMAVSARNIVRHL